MTRWTPLRLVVDAAFWVNRATSRVPVLGPMKARTADMILDRLFGPAEDFEYVSTTAPSSPPPTIP